MFDLSFFTGRVGLAALLSIAAMVTFNVFALTQTSAATHSLVIANPPLVELA